MLNNIAIGWWSYLPMSGAIIIGIIGQMAGL